MSAKQNNLLNHPHPSNHILNTKCVLENNFMSKNYKKLIDDVGEILLTQNDEGEEFPESLIL